MTQSAPGRSRARFILQSRTGKSEGFAIARVLPAVIATSVLAAKRVILKHNENIWRDLMRKLARTGCLRGKQLAASLRRAWS
jgi:hypothetical protein